jgi:hypothetical protein
MIQRLNRTEPSTKILHRLREAGLGSSWTGQGHGPDEGALIRDNQGVPVIGFFLYRLATIADDLRNNWHVSLLTIERNSLYGLNDGCRQTRSGRRRPVDVRALMDITLTLGNV